MKIPVKLTLATNTRHYGVPSGTIHDVDLEEYVKAVTASEISNSHIEACKVQAIAARTFALRRVRNRGYVHDTTIDQAFIVTRNDVSRYPNAIKGAEETKGMVLTYKGTILLDCPYGAGNGGKTKAYKNYPYLIEKNDPWDTAETVIMKSRGERTRLGNGYGMSQYGARYAANNGKTYKEILSFYYPAADITFVGEQPIAKPNEEVKDLALNAMEQSIKQWALAQVGKGYVWGATGETLTRAGLDKLIKRHGTNVRMPTAEKWIGETVFDCASLVSEALSKNMGLSVVAGASSQWKGNYWDEKGTIDTQPRDRVVVLYRTSPNANPMQHTGIYLGDGRVVDARGTNSGVMLSQLEKYAWTHWAAPKGLHAAQPKEEVNIVTIGTAVIMNGNLALRAEPSTNARLVRYMMDKETIEVLHRANNEWFKVRHKGTEGYAMAKFLNFTPSASPAPVPVPVPPQQDGKYTVKIVCNTQAEADALLRLLKGAVIE